MRVLPLAILFVAGTACAQTYASRPITLVNRFPPGGPTDLTGPGS